jgi:hypothetical protein
MNTPKEACDYLREILNRTGTSPHPVSLRDAQDLCEQQLAKEQAAVWEKIHDTLYVARRDGAYIGHVDTSSSGWFAKAPGLERPRAYTSFEAAKKGVELC